jgi:hypothetical protein
MYPLQTAIGMLTLASIHAFAEPVSVEPRTIVDFACIAKEERECGKKGGEPINEPFSSVSSDKQPVVPLTNRPLTAECIVFLIANTPPACVASVFDVSTVASMLAAAETRARRREREMCLAIARDPLQCPSPIVAN